MKAEERKHLEQNELLRRLNEWWKSWKSEDGKPSNTIWIVLGVGVLAVILVIGYRYYRSSAEKNRANLWAAFDLAYSPDQLEAIIDKNKGTPAALAAKVQLARLKLQEGMTKIGSDQERFRDDGTKVSLRVEAIKDLIQARSLYEELAKDASDDSRLVRESLLARAKIAETLTAVPDPGNSQEILGSLDTAASLYEEFAAKAGDSQLGKEATERAKDIREHKETIQKFYEGLQARALKGPLPPLTGPFEPPRPDPFKPTDPIKSSDPTITPIPGKPADKTPVGPVLQPIEPKKSVESKPGDPKPVDPKPGEPKPAPALIPAPTPEPAPSKDAPKPK